MGNALRSLPFRTFCYCGLAGVLVDIDHPIAYYLLPGASGRFLHTPLLIASCIVLGGLCAYLGGLFIRLVLRRRFLKPYLKPQINSMVERGYYI